MDPQSGLFLAHATIFRHFSNFTTVLLLDSFRSYLEELLLIKLSLTLKILLQNIKSFVRYLGPNLARNKKN